MCIGNAKTRDVMGSDSTEEENHSHSSLLYSEASIPSSLSHCHTRLKVCAWRKIVLESGDPVHSHSRVHSTWLSYLPASISFQP